MKLYLFAKLFFWLGLNSVGEYITIAEPLEPTQSIQSSSSTMSTNSGIDNSNTSVLSRSTGTSKEIAAQSSSTTQDDFKDLFYIAATLYENLKKTLLEFEQSTMKIKVPLRDHQLSLKINDLKSRLSGEDLLNFIHSCSSLQFGGMSEDVRENILFGIEAFEELSLSCEEQSENPDTAIPDISDHGNVRVVIDKSKSLKKEDLCIQAVIDEANERARERKPHVPNNAQNTLLNFSRARIKKFISSRQYN